MAERYPERGDLAIHRTGGVFVFGPRKEDRSGWWGDRLGGLSDRALNSDDWIVLSRDEVAELFAVVRASGVAAPEGDDT